MSQKHARDESNDSDCDENLWEAQRDRDTESENPVDNNYNGLYQISLEVCIPEPLSRYLKFIDQSLKINACRFIQVI